MMKSILYISALCFILGCNLPRQQPNKYHTGEMVYHKVADRECQVTEVNRYSDGVRYMVRMKDDIGQIHVEYVSEFELEKK